MPNKDMPNSNNNKHNNLRYIRQARAATGVLRDQFEEDLTIQATDLHDNGWMNLDVQTTADAEQYINKYRAFTDMNQRVAYKDLSTVEKISMVEEGGSMGEYIPERIQTDSNERIVGWILKPLNTPAGEIPKIKVVFKGTNPRSMESIACDLERGGPGAESFARNRDAILGQINQTIANSGYHQVSIDVGGHSLGNAFASYYTAAIREGVAQNLGLTSMDPIPENVRNQFGKIQTLRVSGNNGAGINAATANRNAAVVGYIAGERAKGRTDLTLESYQLHRNGDGVQQTGETELDAGVPHHHVKVDVMKVHGTSGFSLSLPTAGAIVATGVATGGMGAAVAVGAVVANGVAGAINTSSKHRCNIFAADKPPAVYTFERLSNQSMPDAVSKELNNKSSWLNRIQRGAFAVKDGIVSVISSTTCLFGMSHWFSRSTSKPDSTVASSSVRSTAKIRL